MIGDSAKPDPKAIARTLEEHRVAYEAAFMGRIGNDRAADRVSMVWMQGGSCHVAVNTKVVPNPETNERKNQRKKEALSAHTPTPTLS